MKQVNLSLPLPPKTSVTDIPLIIVQVILVSAEKVCSIDTDYDVSFWICPLLQFPFISLSEEKNKQITCCVLKYINVQNMKTNRNGNDISLYHHFNCFPQTSDESRNTGGEQTENHEEYQHVPCIGYLVSFQRHNI